MTTAHASVSPLTPRPCRAPGSVCRTALLVCLAACMFAPTRAPAAGDLRDGFRTPPEATKPWCYYYWISDNISAEGISRDLEAMARVGIGEALIGNIFLEDMPAGEIKVLSDAWWGLIEHAIREGNRVGVNIGMFNCPGWSQSGGPWVKPTQAMRYLVSSETRVRGPVKLDRKLPAPADPFQDVAVLAFPTPKDDAEALRSRGPEVTCSPAARRAERATDGKPDTALTFPPGAGKKGKTFRIDIKLDAPLTARHLSLVPSESSWSAQVELRAGDGQGGFRTVRRFTFDRSNMKVNVGPMPRGPVTISFPAVTADRFRLVFTKATGKPALAEIELSPAARLESYIEKQLGKMHPTPLPMWDDYLWPAQPESDEPLQAVRNEAVRVLSDHLAADGTLRWDVPAGDWVIVRIGMTPTGTRNQPSSPEGQGLEIDKMNRQVVEAHFNAFIGKVLERLPAAERKAFQRVVADSYEMGPQNWTDGFAATFRDRYGYDPIPWLPVLTGRIVGSADESNRFLWDLRRLVADRIAKDYVGALSDLCRPHGLELWLENYGHWGFPAEFLQYGGHSDRIGGEFWVTGSLGSIECRAASSAANIYGFPVVSAEAFTGGPHFQSLPADLKARGDWCFCEGINHFVLHVYIQQPWNDRKPGVNAWFGTEFNRHNTWFDDGRPWINYLRRCCFLLQQGTRLADVAYFIGEDTPKMTGVRKPELPPGRDFDYINAEVILDKLQVADGLLALPHGTTYRMLVLPELSTMRPELLAKIHDLVAAGATVLGKPPTRSPSLERYPRCDEDVRRLATGVWGKLDVGQSGQRRLGKGRVVWGKGIEDVFRADGLPPDFDSEAPLLWTHRVTDEAHAYFVSNQKPKEIVTTVTCRIDGLAPELWWPKSGRIEKPALYDVRDGTVRLPLHLGPHGSVFIVFRKAKAEADRIVSVSRDGKKLIDLRAGQVKGSEPIEDAAGDAAGTFTMALWAKPTDTTTLPKQSNEGVHGHHEPRNDAIYPPHGEQYGDATHAGCGIAVGTNGVCVFEHSSNYFSPPLVHPAKITDWTHVAVVYRDGRPSLYLNGKHVRTGLKSNRAVHLGEGSGGGEPFRGKKGAVRRIGRALDEDEVVALMRSTPRPGTRPDEATVTVVRQDGGVQVRAWRAGRYVLTRADGSTKTVEVPALPKPIDLTGAWHVRFDPNWGPAEPVTFDELKDWSKVPQADIKHYSGKATYRKTFTLPGSWKGKRVMLDLGEVCDLAVVRLNGKEVATLWLEPWTADVTTAVRSGENRLEVDVVNAWNNRIVGDLNLPADKRRTFLLKDTISKTAPLLSAGLLGPVTIEAGVVGE